MTKAEMTSLFAYGTPFLGGEPCPECGKDFTDSKPIHRPCLEKKWDGEIPQEIEALIKEFNLEGAQGGTER